jgi:hypothetical protein
MSLTRVRGRSRPLAVSVCHLPLSSSYSMVSVWPGISCSSAAAERLGMCRKGFRKHAVNLIGPAAVVLDNLVGDFRHGTPLSEVPWAFCALSETASY